MCGIAGFVSSRRDAGLLDATRAMTDALARRGPDSEGLEEWPGAALGHRRLSILDLSAAGNQPMLSEDRETAVVFNGCIYNFQELRRELESAGRKFFSRCDTEVLLNGYQQWGIDEMVRRLRGMFAFGIWDNRRRRLTLVRDRLGVKPLVYWRAESSLAFASTIGALRAAGLCGGIDRESVMDFLKFGFVTAERSIYCGIHKLPPATILEWENGRVSERLYWTLPQAGSSASMSFDAAIEETESRLLEAVRVRLVADVNVAALLSGGIDSALVCWALKRLNANIHAFTVGAPGDPSDETAAARHTACVLGIPHDVIHIPAHRPPPLEELNTAFGEPFACQSALGMLAVTRAVAPHAKVLLTGDGGDDVFLGYPFFRNARIAEQVARYIPPVLVPVCSRIGASEYKSIPLRRLRTLLNCSTQGLAGFVGAQDRAAYYAPLLGDRLLHSNRRRHIQPSLASARNLQAEVFAYHLRHHFTGEFMVKVDGASMHNGLEARAPFLDHQLWEFAAPLPFSTRLPGLRLKAILREICKRRVGAAIANRPKAGFTVPVERWLAERWTNDLAALRGETRLVREGWIRPGMLDIAFGQASRQNRVPVQLWYLLVLEHWLQANSISR
ncbi:MAG: asparagine synthase (glutamine-hydrolyzing), partial [Bryobacterales bacterium]|nr:asparagine synthase (glutamine-hydrolyzing) [Bryobacterales bacterium]MBV9400336.1 asparagine synthase (glutamine-hydrolyzing) [Bryobacterales bacterium]